VPHANPEPEGKPASHREPIQKEEDVASQPRMYRRTKKEPVAHTWRTRPDPFEQVWSQLRLQLEIDPNQTAKQLFACLQERHPGAFSAGQLRTLQRRVRQSTIHHQLFSGRWSDRERCNIRRLTRILPAL
jgi:hypothetical protein